MRSVKFLLCVGIMLGAAAHVFAAGMELRPEGAAGGAESGKEAPAEFKLFKYTTPGGQVAFFITSGREEEKTLKQEKQAAYDKAREEWKVKEKAWKKATKRSDCPYPAPQRPRVSFVAGPMDAKELLEKRMTKELEKLNRFCVTRITDEKKNISYKVLPFNDVPPLERELLATYAAKIQPLLAAHPNASPRTVRPKVYVVKRNFKTREDADKESDKLTARIKKRIVAPNAQPGTTGGCRRRIRRRPRVRRRRSSATTTM